VSHRRVTLDKMLLNDSFADESIQELLIDFPQKPRMLTENRRRASRLLALRRALTVAAASTQSKITNSYLTRQYVMHARTKIELDCSLKSIELRFMDCLRDMDHDNRIDTLFELFDKDGNHYVSIVETQDFILERMKRSEATSQFIDEAKKLMALYERSDDLFDRQTFSSLMEGMQRVFRCETFLQFCTFIAQQGIFNEDTRRILEDSIQDNIEKAARLQRNKSALAQICDVVVEARIVILFAMLDSEITSIVAISNAVKHLYNFSKRMDPLKREVLLTYDSNDLRLLSLCEFSEFLLNIIAVSPEGTTIHDLADEMTLSVARDKVSERDLKELFMNTVECLPDVDSEIEHPTADLFFAYGRLERLFTMLDRNHDSFLSPNELFHLLRRYTMSSTATEKAELFSKYDVNADGRLDFEEFAKMIISFAGTKLDPHKLIDYLCVQVSLDDDWEQAKEYEISLNSLRTFGTNLRSSISYHQKNGITLAKVVNQIQQEGSLSKPSPSDKNFSLVTMVRRKSAELMAFRRNSVTIKK
jgi:Ca2+-binding EF-hand superfamily protein